MRRGWRRLPSGDAPGRTGVARALVPQHRERVEARRVAVAPRRLDGVATDQREAGDPGLLLGERRRTVEPARDAGFATAERAWTHPAQGRGVVGRRVAVGPLDEEGAGSPIAVDPGGRGGRIGHAFDRSPRSFLPVPGRNSGPRRGVKRVVSSAGVTWGVPRCRWPAGRSSLLSMP